MSNLIDQCRDLTQLNPLVRVLLQFSLEDIKRHGINPLVVETYRPIERQQYLYCQGRTISECIAAGINREFAEAYSNPKAAKITWTMNSIHIQRKAVDIVPQRLINKKLTAIWNSQDTQTKAIINTMSKYGFEPGANWNSNPDSPHFQIKGDFVSTFSFDHTTTYISKIVQTALNKKIGAELTADGAWGTKTTAAVNAFRKQHGWEENGKLGSYALTKLLE